MAAEREMLPPRYQGVAAERCLRDLDRFDRSLHEAGFGVLGPDSDSPFVSRGYFDSTGTPRHRIRVLRSAAYALAMEGSEARCQAVLDDMRSLFRRHQQAIEGRPANAEERSRWRHAHLARSHPVSAMLAPLPVGVLIGADLRNRQDERLGEITDVVLDPADGRVAFVLVARGGFLGIGADLVAVRWQDLRATEDHETFVLDVPSSLFDSAPRVERRSSTGIARDAWREPLERFWGRIPNREGNQR